MFINIELSITRTGSLSWLLISVMPRLVYFISRYLCFMPSSGDNQFLSHTEPGSCKWLPHTFPVCNALNHYGGPYSFWGANLVGNIIGNTPPSFLSSFIQVLIVFPRRTCDWLCNLLEGQQNCCRDSCLIIMTDVFVLVCKIGRKYN